jgi:ATP:ADP antiporter, AAA family
MLATGFFMGAFIATYQVTADSLFLNRLGDQLNRAFIIAGALGIITTGVFSFFQNIIRFTTLVLGSVILIFFFSLGAYLLLEFGAEEYHNTFVFALYCMTGPLTAVLLLSYWGLFGRLFNFRQSKRIIGWIDTGQLIAAILATLILIPFTSDLVGDPSRYLIFCSISMFIVSILLIVISSTFTISKDDPREFGSEVRKETRLFKLMGEKYILLMSLFLLISMTTLMLTQFSFQTLVRQQYPDQNELTRFNSFFTGAVYGLSLIMQTFINNRIISNYGLRIALFILPIVVGILAILAAGIGGIFGFDKALAPAGFIYFFLFVALTRLFNWTLRESLENPVFKLLFIPLDTRLRFHAQSKVEGLINECSRFVAGALIFSFAFIPFFKIIHIPVLLACLVAGYLVVVYKLYNGYRSKIRQKLEAVNNVKLEKLDRGYNVVTSKLENLLHERNSSRAVFSYKLLEKINASNMGQWINTLIKNEDEATRHYAQEKINELKGLSVSDRYVIKIDQQKASDGKNVLSKFDLQSILDNEGDITKGRIQKLSRSSDPNDRLYAAELLLHAGREEGTAFLMELLQDLEPKVRNTAIKTSIKRATPEIINILIDNLSNPVFSNQALNALVLIGPDTLGALESAFYRSGQNTQVMLKIIQVMGRIGGQRVKELLWNKIDYPNKVVVSQVLLSLGEAGFKAGISQITRIKYAIEADIADIRWNLSAIQEVSDEAFARQIKQALRWEIKNDIEHVYMLLAMLYDTRSIQLVKENIESGTADGVTYAVELLDVFLIDQLKQRVIPILDDLTEIERINRLEDYYPRVKLDSRLVLKFIINRDFTQSNRWSKACVINQIAMLRLGDFKMDLIAQLFNPDLLIREISASALYQISPNEYHVHAKRLGDGNRRHLDEVILFGRKMSRFETVMFFLKLPIFSNVAGITLSYLADISEEIHMKEGDRLVLDERFNNNFFVVVSGNVQFFLKGELTSNFSSGQFIGEMLGLPTFVNTNLLTASDDAVVIRFNKDQFYELLSDNVSLADKMIEYI